MKFTIGTRGSRLSLIQTEEVIRNIKEENPETEIETKVIETSGDKKTDKPLISLKGEGVFEKEINKALLRGEVDIAVHSMKDVPILPPSKIALVAVPKRRSPHDVLASKEESRKMKDLPKKAVIGTGSPRRKAQLLHIRPDLEVKSIRGNVDTRIRKLERGLYDALILAQIGLQRLEIQNCRIELLPLKDFPPAPGQGALAVMARKDDREVLPVLNRINHTPSQASIMAERTFLKEIGGGCKVPVGALAQLQENQLSLHASILSPKGNKKIETSQMGDLESPKKLGSQVAREIKKAGGMALLKPWRNEHGRG